MFDLDIGFPVLVLDFQFKCKMCWSAGLDSLQVCQGRRQVIFYFTLDFQFWFWIFNSNVRCVGLLVGIVCRFARGEGKSCLN